MACWSTWADSLRCFCCCVLIGGTLLARCRRRTWTDDEPVYDLLRVSPAALKTGSECSFTPVNSASSPVYALHGSSSRDRKQVLRAQGAPRAVPRGLAGRRGHLVPYAGLNLIRFNGIRQLPISARIWGTPTRTRA